MATTNSEHASTAVPLQSEDEVEEEVYKRVTIFDLYKFLTGPYYFLLFIGFVAA